MFPRCPQCISYIWIIQWRQRIRNAPLVQPSSTRINERRSVCAGGSSPKTGAHSFIFRLKPLSFSDFWEALGSGAQPQKNPNHFVNWEMNQTWVFGGNLCVKFQLAHRRAAGPWTPQVPGMGSVPPKLKRSASGGWLWKHKQAQTTRLKLTWLCCAGADHRQSDEDAHGEVHLRSGERGRLLVCLTPVTHMSNSPYPQFFFCLFLIDWLSSRARHQIKEGEEGASACAPSEAAPWTALTQRLAPVCVSVPRLVCLGQFPPQLLSAIYSSHCQTAGGWGSVCVYVRVCVWWGGECACVLFEFWWTDGVNTPPEYDWHRLHPIIADIPEIFSGFSFWNSAHLTHHLLWLAIWLHSCRQYTCHGLRVCLDAVKQNQIICSDSEGFHWIIVLWFIWSSFVLSC